MPPARNQRSETTGEDAFQVRNWTAPAESAPPQTFSFAPNVTPVTFTESDSLLDGVPEDSQLFPSSVPDDYTPPTPRKQNHGKKRAHDHIPRPPNAFILFRSSFIRNQHVSSHIEGNRGTLSTIVGLVWHSLPYEERQVWQAKAKRALAEHKKRFPDFSFKSNKEKDVSTGSHGNGGVGTKRKTRETGPKDDQRCEKIATLLASGMKGKDLEAAIEEFDRNRSQEVLTRFEDPVTARQFRRSSSAPAPPTDKLKAESAFMVSDIHSHKRRRSSSTSPPEAVHSNSDSRQVLSRQPTLVLDMSCASHPDSCYGGSSPTNDLSVASSPTSAGVSFAGDYESDASMDLNNFSFTSSCATPNSDVCSPLDYAAINQKALDVCFDQTSTPTFPKADSATLYSNPQPSFDNWNNTPEYIPSSSNDSIPTTSNSLVNCGLPSPAEYGQFNQYQMQAMAIGYEQQVSAYIPDRSEFHSEIQGPVDPSTNLSPSSLALCYEYASFAIPNDLPSSYTESGLPAVTYEHMDGSVPYFLQLQEQYAQIQYPEYAQETFNTCQYSNAIEPTHEKARFPSAALPQQYQQRYQHDFSTAVLGGDLTQIMATIPY